MLRHIAYSDFWPVFENSLFHLVLQELGYRASPDFSGARSLIYANLGDRHKSFAGTKIFYTAESLLPRWQECDYAIGFLKDNLLYPDCYLRLPYWVLAHHDSPRSIFEARECTPDMLNRPFCSFVTSNAHNSLRNQFFLDLCQYKQVCSGGREYNNIGRKVEDKVAFCSNYKFNISFENYSARGYCTEKLFDAFAAGSLPIYWGDPSVIEDINPSRFINAHDFKNKKDLIEYIKQVDTDDELYATYFSEPVFLKHQKDMAFYVNGLRDFLSKALSHTFSLRGRRLKRDGYEMMPESKSEANWGKF